MPQIKDPAKLAEIKARATALKSVYATRDSELEEYENAYFMYWSMSVPDGADIIVSPDARNHVLGALRLMTATDPQINVPKTAPDKDMSNLEKFLESAFYYSGRNYGIPIHHEMILSAMLYSEMHVSIELTKDLLEAAKTNGRAVKRFERLAQTTPFVFVPWNPKGGYPEMTRYGMTGYYRVEETTVLDVQTAYGAYISPEFAALKPNQKVNLNIWYDDDYKAVWTDQEDIYMDEHGFGCIPVVCQVTDGSNLFTEPERQRSPFLYTLIKSKVWEQQSAALSAMYHYVKNLAAIPLMIHTAPKDDPNKKLKIEYSKGRPFGVVELAPDEQFQPVMSKGIIDPAVREMYDTGRRLLEESTIYKAALGAPPETTSTFSELSLLATSGRLPLIAPQRRGGWGISNLLETALLMLKSTTSGKVKTYTHEINLKDIPDVLMVEAKLEINLPEDQLQLANVAMMLQKGGLASNEWIQENILKNRQPESMQEQIWSEKAAEAMFQKFMQETMSQQQPANSTPQEPQSLPPGAGQEPQSLPPGAGADPAMMQGAAEAMQGLPPQMAGMVRGAGEGMGLPAEAGGQA